MPMYNTIKEFCDKRGITPYALGKKSGVSCQTVYRLTGDPLYLPSMPVVEKICEAFGVQPSELIKYQESEES